MMPTRAYWHWFQFVILINLLLIQRAIINVNGQSFSSTETKAHVEESIYTLMDSILEDLTQKYDSIKTDDFWHPYDFGTGNDNREAINVVDILERQIPGKFLQWKREQLGLKQKLIGLTASSIEIYDSKLQRIFTKDMPFVLNTMETFTRWDTNSLTPFTVIVVATAASSPGIIMLKLSGDEELEEIGSFPLPSSVQSVMRCYVDSSEKLLLVPQDANVPISIYNIEITQNEAQLWFLQRFSEPEFESVTVHQPDTVDSMILITTANQMHVYQFDTSLGQFIIKQTLPVQQKCNHLMTFTMMYHHYVGCMTQGTSKEIQFLSYNFNVNEYEESSLNRVKASEMFPVVIGGARGDLVFVARDDDDAIVNILLYDGQSKFRTVNVACRSANCAKLPTLSNGANFEFEDSTALVLPTATNGDSATVLTFLTELMVTVSPILLQSKGLFEEFKALSNDMNRWRSSVSNAEKTLERKLNTEGDNIITGKWEIKTLVADDVDVEGTRGRDGRAATSDNVFNMLKFGDVEWTEEDFATTNDQISSHMGVMESDLSFISNALNDALLKHFPGVQTVESMVSMQGNILAENAGAITLNVKSIWDHNTTEYFMSLANRPNDVLRIKGGLTFSEPLIADNVETEKINDVLVKHLAVLSAHNVFDCPSTFETVHANRDVTAQLVNGHNLVDSVVMAHSVDGFHFTDGIVAYMGAETMEHTPFNDVLLSSVAQTVESPVSFKNVEVLAPMSVESLNGKDFKTLTDHIITKDHKGKIKGTKIFTGSVNLTTLFILNEWNGLAFPSEFLSVSKDSIVLNGKKAFVELVADKLSVAGEINGINTADLVSLTEADEMMNTVWIFNGNSKILNNIAVENTVDGVLMESLFHQDTLDLQSVAFNPNADIIFTQPVHIEDLSVSSTINDKSFEEIFGNIILFEGTDCRVPGTTTIKDMATFNDLKLQDNKINGILLDNFLTKDTFQTISNPVIIAESVFFEELHARDHFDGVRVQDVLENAMRVSEETSDGTMIPWQVHFESIVCKSDFVVDGLINDMAAYSKSVALTKGERSQIINGPIESIRPIFSNLAPKNLQIPQGRTIQSLDVNEWNLTRAKLSEPASFSHPFFVNRILVQENLETQNINGIDIDGLATSVFRNNGQSQQFDGPITLDGLSVHNGDLHFHQSVDGFLLDDYVAHGFPLKAKNKEPILLNGGWEFQSMKLAKGININGAICGVDLDALQTDSVNRNDKDVKILGKTSFANPLHITQSLNSPQVNGKQMEKMFLLDTEQDVEGHPTFLSDLSNEVLTADSINNVDLTWLKEKYSFVDGQHILAHNAFTKLPLEMKSLRVTGKTQGHNFKEFTEDIVKLSDPNIKFNDKVAVTSPISVGGSARTILYNGINVDDLSSDVVQITDNVQMTNPVSFTNSISAENVIVNGDLRAKSLPDGINWDDLQTKSFKLEDIKQPANFNNLHFEDLITTKPVVTSQLNGRSFEDFLTLNTPQNLGTLRIAKLSLESANVDIGGKLGSHDISEEFKDTLMKNKTEPQRILGSTVMKGPVHIKQNISCFGPDFQAEVVTSNDKLELGPVEFISPVVVENDITLNGPIDGRNLESLFSGALMTDSDQVISNQWEFLGPVTFLNGVSGAAVGDKVNLQALVDEKNEELRRAEKKVDVERASFIRKCTSLQNIRNTIAKNPVKFDSFDTHQVIALKNEGKNVVVVEGGNGVMMFVQTTNCRLDRYQWISSTELFHKIVEEPPYIGNVDDWQSVPLNNGSSIIVFAKSPSSCSNELGLFAITVTSTGDLSEILTIRDNFPVESFKLVMKPDSGEIKLFNLINNVNSMVEVFTWTESKFVFQESVHFDTPMVRVDAVASSQGFGIMCHSANSVTMYDISRDRTKDVVASRAMLTSEKGTMAVFENFDTLYALLSESGTTSPSLIQPTCNFQVLRLHDNSIESVQKLQVPEVVSATMMSFSNKNFVIFLSKSHGLSVHKFMGLNGFQQVGKPYKVFDGFILKSFFVKKSGFEMAQPFLLVLSQNTVKIFRGNVFGDLLNSGFEPLCDI